MLPDTTDPAAPPALAARHRARPWLAAGAWLLGLGVLAGVVLQSAQRAKLDAFVALTERAQPGWLALALICQVGTYMCAAAVWQRALAHADARRPLRVLIPMSLAKLFADQALPSGGLSGNALVVRGLATRGVPAGRALAVLAHGLAAHNLAALALTAAALGVLALRGHLHLALLTLAFVYAVYMIGVLVLLGWGLRDAGVLRRLRRWLPRSAGALADAGRSVAALRTLRLLAGTAALQGGIYLLDAATLWSALHAVGSPAPAAAVYAAFMMASIAMEIGPVPLGLGTFEGTCVAVLVSLGVPMQSALAGTLLTRGLTLWLPMLPGYYLARRVLRSTPGAAPVA